MLTSSDKNFNNNNKKKMLLFFFLSSYGTKRWRIINQCIDKFVGHSERYKFQFVRQKLFLLYKWTCIYSLNKITKKKIF